MSEENKTDEFKQAMWAGQASIMVAVRPRPLLGHDRDNVETVKVMDNKVVVVMDPGNEKDVVGKLRNRNREKKYAFDYVFSPDDSQMTVYENTTKFLIHGILRGFNATVFAYGCTGAGKTHTMLGSPNNPGIMALTLEDLFENIENNHRDAKSESNYRVIVSFLEVYNENIRDLLASSSSEYLELREDPQKGPIVAGITEIEAINADQVMGLLHKGNRKRTQEATAANAVSSRSHAVLQVIVEQTEKNPGKTASIKYGKLSMIDLAGSERAANTKNRGQRLLEGANINRSLLALGNCINALGEKANKSSFVPYRDSKLTRLLKDSLGGNCRTVMITNISMAKSSFEETLNTLKYANRAKNIKTTVTRNVLKVNYHITEYVSLIDALKSEISKLKSDVGSQDTSSSNDTHESANIKSDQKFSEIRKSILANFRERMRLRRSLIVLENQNVTNSIEIGKHQLMSKEFERQLEDGEQNDEDRNEGPEVDEQLGYKLSAEHLNLTSKIDESKKEISHFKKEIKRNLAKKSLLSQQLANNEEIAENYRRDFEATGSSGEKKELLLMEYRIGKLELENMELEQEKTVHDTVVCGKDLTIQKLQMELEVRNKLLRQQQSVLESHNLDGAIKYGIINSIEEVSLSEGFETLQQTMQRMTTPPSRVEAIKNISLEADSDTEHEIEITGKAPETPRHFEESTLQPDTDDIDIAMFEPGTSINSKFTPSSPVFSTPHRKSVEQSGRSLSYGNKQIQRRRSSRVKQEHQREWATQWNASSLPYIRIKTKANGVSPYLKSMKQRRIKSSKLPLLNNESNYADGNNSTRF